MSRNTVADIVVDGLRRAGTPRLFAVTGSETHPLCAAARAAELPLTLTSTPQAACIMAAVAGDLAEVPGAALLGPSHGDAAAIEGVARARVDRAPMIVLTSGPSPAAAICKGSLSVTSASACHWIAHAARLATSEPRGPVHLEVSADVWRHLALPLLTSCRPDPLSSPDPVALDAAARMLATASRPLLIAGLHCRSAGVQPWVRALAEALPAPLLATPRGKGALPDPHPLTIGVLGGDDVDERLPKEADLVVGLGLDELEHLPEPLWSTVPVLAVGPPGVLAARRPAIEVSGEITTALEELAPRLRDRARADWDVARLERLKRELAAAPVGRDQARARRQIIGLAREAMPGGTIATVDAGSHLADVAVAWHAIAPRELLVSNGRASADFALPAAVAAHLIQPDRRVVCFTRTAGPMSSPHSLETATRLGAALVIVVFTDTAPDAPMMMRLAEGFGVTAFFAEGAARFGEALGRALRMAGPSLIAVQP